MNADTFTLPPQFVSLMRDIDYSPLVGLVLLYEDQIMLQKVIDGQLDQAYQVDPDDLAARLAGLAITSGPLPRNCLFWQRRNGRERLGVYVEPKVWAVQVAGEKRTWQVPMPGLVWIGDGNEYFVYAVTDPWPGPDSRLYHVPAPNAWTDKTGVCQGNVPFPAASTDTIWPALEMFFGSTFNSHLSNGKSRKHYDNVLGMWRELHQAGATEYPTGDLIDSWTRLREVMNK